MRNPRRQNAYPDEQREARPFRLDDLGRAGRDQHHEERRGQDRHPGIEGRIGEHVLQELLSDEHRPHQRPEDDDPGAGSHPEHPPTGDVQVVQRVGGSPLPDHERDPGRDRDEHEADHERTFVRHGREVDAQDQAADEQHRQDPAEVVDRVGRLVHVGGNEANGKDERDDRERQRDQEDGSPPEVSSRSPENSGPSAAIAPPIPDHSAIDFVRPWAGPQRRDQRQGGRERHAGGESAPKPSDEEERVARSVGGEQAEGDRERGPEDEHELAAVPVADGAEPQHGCRESERIPHRDQVQASSGTNRTPPRSTGGRRWRPRGSGWRPPRPG